MTTLTTEPPTALSFKPAAKPRVPALVTGDALTRDEFERRYEAMPSNVRAELIQGVVYITASPVRIDLHSSPQSILARGLPFTKLTPTA